MSAVGNFNSPRVANAWWTAFQALACGIIGSARWMWFNADPFSIADPFSTTPPGSFGHQEFLIFRRIVGLGTQVPRNAAGTPKNADALLPDPSLGAPSISAGVWNPIFEPTAYSPPAGLVPEIVILGIFGGPAGIELQLGAPSDPWVLCDPLTLITTFTYGTSISRFPMPVPIPPTTPFCQPFCGQAVVVDLVTFSLRFSNALD